MEWDSGVYELYGMEDRTAVITYSQWTRCIHPSDRPAAVAHLMQALDEAGPLDVEFRVVWPAGDVRYLRTRGKLLHDPTGNGSRMVGVTWDVTEVRVMANALRAEKERAEKASEAKSEFLARMSHEVRTPMNGIIGFTTLVLDSDLTAGQRRHLTLVRDAGHSLLAITNDVLDFSKLEAGKVELERIPFNLAELVDGALAIVRGQAFPKGIVLAGTSTVDTPVWVTGDPTRLRQILLNLLTNAVKFTNHGSIRLGVLPQVGGPADRIRFEIVDTGIGNRARTAASAVPGFLAARKIDNPPLWRDGPGLGDFQASGRNDGRPNRRRERAWFRQYLLVYRAPAPDGDPRVAAA